MSTRQDGFSLIESLISITILSIGLIGMAGMQTRAYLDANQSYLYSIAQLAAIDAQENLWLERETKDCPDIISEFEKETEHPLLTSWKERWFENENSPLYDRYNGSIEPKNDSNCVFKVTVGNLKEPVMVRLP